MSHATESTSEQQAASRRAAHRTVLWLGVLALVVYVGFIVLNLGAK
jgi:fucose permease